MNAISQNPFFEVRIGYINPYLKTQICLLNVPLRPPWLNSNYPFSLDTLLA